MTPQIRRELEAKADPMYLAKIRELVPGNLKIIGVRVPAIRALARQHAELGIEDVGVAFERRCREEMLLGVFVLARSRKRLTPELWAHVDAWIDAIDNWEVCDQLAMNVAAPIVAKKPALARVLVTWARAKNPWRRRFALACAAALNQGGRRFPAEALAVCAEVLADEDPSVRKAAGWALRETCKTDAAAVFALLKSRRASIHPQVFREGSEKLPPAKRAELLRSETR